MTDSIVSRSTSSTCLICDAPLSWSRAQGHRLCLQAECAWRYSLLKKQNKLCQVCSRPLMAAHWAAGLCANPDCRRAALAERAKKDYQRRVQQEHLLQAQATGLRDQVLHRFGIGKPTSFLLAIVPAAVHRITRLPASRRREFSHYLKSLIDRALLVPMPPVAECPPLPEALQAQEDRLQAASGNACACCQGSCCRGGAYTQAYLGVETLQRYRASHPAQGPNQILAAYLGFIGKETYEGSCVYQQVDGCSLPRELRADICNTFYCSGLQSFRSKVPTVGPVRGFVVAATDGVMHRAALVHEEQRLMIPVPPASAD